MPSTETTGPVFALDWVPLEAVPESLLDRECFICGGRYIDPLSQGIATPAGRSPIHARSVRSRMEGNDAILFGDVTAVQGDRYLRSDTLVIDREEESATLTGNVTLREPGILLHGDRARIFTRTGEALAYDAEFVFHREHMRGTAATLERDEDGVIHIHDGKFTFCAPGEYDWAVRSDNLEVDLDEGLATARGATLEVEGVPVFYTPWLQLPLDDRRRTGLLWPDFGNDSTGGIDISQPVYLNLAPNYDALYSPRYIEKRGVNHQGQARYLHPNVGHWLVGGAYMNDDNRYADQVDPGESTDRWLRVVKQHGLFQQRWRSRVDYGKVSDVNYIRDLETANIDQVRSTALLQMASMDYLGDRWLFNLRAQQFQTLAEDIKKDYEEKPQFTGVYRSDGTPFELQPIFLAQYSNFGHEDNVVTGERAYAEAGLSYPMLWQFGSLQPTVKYRQLNYDLSTTELFSDSSPSAGSAMFNLDGSLIFERQTSVGGRGFVQTLEPRLYYLYSEYENQTDQPEFDTAELTFTYQQLFRDTRFSGRDRLDDANQLSAGLTTRYIDDTTGRDVLSASIGQIYYFDDRNVRLRPTDRPIDDTSSQIAGELGFMPSRQTRLRSSVVWDPHEDNLYSALAVFSYRTDNDALFNVGYSYRRAFINELQPETEEARFSSFLPIDNNWSIFGALHYSLEDSTTVEDMFGVEYDTCCWTARLLQLRYYNNVTGAVIDFRDPDLERERTLQFQIVLKGMGGFGNRLTNIMESMIRGYEERGY